MAWGLCAPRIETAALEATGLDHPDGAYQPLYERHEVRLLAEPQGGMLDRYTLARRLRRLAVTAGRNPGRTSPKLLRHTLATLAVDAGASSNA